MTGRGAAAFVTHIDKLAATDVGGPHWQYWVNDERADQGCGVHRLQEGDHVLWKLAPQD